MRMDRPSLSAMSDILHDLTKTLDGAEQTQRRMLRVKATVSSEDRLVTATVGPRGQLIDLTIDPRVYRRPNAGALAATIVATVREAAEKAMSEVQAIMDEALPRDLRIRSGGKLDMERLMRSHDADLAAEEEESDGH
jgi:DNA-binding protein YbaB